MDGPPCKSSSRRLDLKARAPTNRAVCVEEILMKLILAICIADNVTVHGFRSSFRDWAGDETSYDLIETALANVIGDKAERAYRRSDALEKRRALMESWAGYCEPNKSAKVLQMRRQPS